MLQVTSIAPQRSSGFALVLALSLMAFILLLLLSVTTLLQVEVSSSTYVVAQNHAKENAKLGMMIALGELQSLTGPDQRVTARASIFDSTSDDEDRGVEVLSPEWIGVWDTTQSGWQDMGLADRIDAAHWLVSGNQGKAITDSDYLKPTLDLSATSLESVVMMKDTSVSPADEVKVSKEDISAVSGSAGGYYAYWVTDENLKARVDMVDPFATSSDHAEQTQSMLQVQRSGVELLADLESYPVNAQSVFKLIDLATTVDLSRPDSSTSTAAVVEDRYFNSLTTVSQGLLVDVKNGGLKRDLTQAFEYRKIFDENFVVDPDTDSEDEALYFLDDTVLTANGIDDVDTSGPNWHILRSYYRQYIQGQHSLDYPTSWPEAEDGEELKLTKLVDLEDYTDTVEDGPDYFQPYKEYVSGSSANQDLSKYLGWQHNMPDYTHAPTVCTGLPYQTIPSYEGMNGTNTYQLFFPMCDNYQLKSWVSPLVGRMQLSYALKSGDEGLEFVITPVFGIYNPYNTELILANLRLKWSVNPLITIDVTDVGSVEFGMREAMPTAADGLVYFRFEDSSTTIRIQPGETRYFGIDKSQYDSERVLSNGVAMFWRDGTTIEANNNESNNISLTPYVSGGGGMVVPLKLRTEYAEQEGTVATEDGVTPIIWYQDGTYSVRRPTKKASWGFTQSEADILNSLVSDTDIDSDEDESPSFKFTMELTEDFGVSMSLGSMYYQDLIRTGKIFADAEESADAISVERTYSNIDSASIQDELLSVGYWLKTTEEVSAPWRNLIDSNIRAINSNSEWDGFDNDNGYRVLSTYTTQDPNGTRGVLTGGATDVQFADGVDESRSAGSWGNSIDPDGQASVILFERPRTALLSLGNLQHANLGRYNFDPTYMVGNSFANVRIPMDKTDSSAHSAWVYTSAENSNPDYENFKIFDTSYLVNEKLWDRYFFSGIIKDIDDDSIADFLVGDSSFANNRYIYTNVAGELSQDDFDARDTGDDTLFHQMAASLQIEGAFNVNSTSVDAWKAVLGGLALETLPTYTYDSGYSSEDGGLIVSRFTWPYNGAVNLATGTGGDNFWKGVRELSAVEVEDLATAIVDQVKTRGPFLSMADFVNRSLTTGETGKMGALQAALDDSKLGVNTSSKLSSYGANGPTSITGVGFNDVFATTNLQAAGFPGYVLQADLLQRLAPILTVRGDTFLIRSYGEYTDQVTGETVADAWCEAIVQRTALPVGADIMTDPQELVEPTSSLGRAYKIVGFRWLDESEL
jgi:hypothetical protein